MGSDPVLNSYEVEIGKVGWQLLDIGQYMSDIIDLLRFHKYCQHIMPHAEKFTG